MFPGCTNPSTFKFDSFKFLTNERDSYCLINYKNVDVYFKIENIYTDETELKMSGRRFTDVGESFNNPVKSSDIGIVLVTESSFVSDIFLCS